LFAILVLGLAAAATPTMAQTATTNVQMRMPSLLILYYQGTVTFDISQADMDTIVGGSGLVDENVDPNIAGFSGDAGITGNPAGNPFTPVGSEQAEVTTFWGVRSMATNQTQVTVSIASGTMTNGASQIVISNEETRLNGDPWAGLTTVLFPPTGMGVGNMQTGDVRFDVDLTNAGLEGLYTGATIDIVATNM
jgi:hypothetical protein